MSHSLRKQYFKYTHRTKRYNSSYLMYKDNRAETRLVYLAEANWALEHSLEVSNFSKDIIDIQEANRQWRTTRRQELLDILVKFTDEVMVSDVYKTPTKTLDVHQPQRSLRAKIVLFRRNTYYHAYCSFDKSLVVISFNLKLSKSVSKYILLHEAAHAMGHYNHGWGFRTDLIRLVRHFMGDRLANSLYSHFQQVGLDMSPPTLLPVLSYHQWLFEKKEKTKMAKQDLAVKLQTRVDEVAYKLSSPDISPEDRKKLQTLKYSLQYRLKQAVSASTDVVTVED